jgi:putative transposase
MPRRPRCCPGGTVFHVLNRSVARLTLFEKLEDYQAFYQVLAEAWLDTPIRILDWCLMPNHWHFVVWPQTDAQTTNFFEWLTHTHAVRWHVHHGTLGTGHLYQGRFKSFPIEEDDHLFSVLRYVERNAKRANIVERAEAWRWGSAWLRQYAPTQARKLLADWPVVRPSHWLDWVNEPQDEHELVAIRRCVQRGTPFGNSHWVTNTAARLGLNHTLRPRGRPSKSRSN